MSKSGARRIEQQAVADFRQSVRDLVARGEKDLDVFLAEWRRIDREANEALRELSSAATRGAKSEAP